MTTDQKIDEVLRIVREQGERNDLRFDRNEEKIEELLKIVRHHDLRFDRLETKDDELSKDLLDLRTVSVEERRLNNARFSQMEHSMTCLHKEVSQLSIKIDKVHESLSADIQGLGEELYETKRGMTLKKKSLS